jgi:hypothetical protein
MSPLHERLGYIKIDAAARRARENWWRSAYREAFYRSVIGFVLACVLVTIVVWVLIVLMLQLPMFQAIK